MITAAAWAALTAACEQAYPREACGWLGGAFDTVRPATTGARDRFAFADADLLALAAAARGPAPPAALFHSHPDGDVALSDSDRAALAPGGVALYPWPHLVIAVGGGRARAAALHAWCGGATVVRARWHRDGVGWRIVESCEA